ncbi:MAG: hypothetical protein NZ922_06795 [Candidatus Methanomethyliaceae archaeon]|nr:hypothetical protein [Candidatus Methanomethyliaceae archaeon]MDW7971136.1 hypothetical protein [Nitrososphaerota archaeon]
MEVLDIKMRSREKTLFEFVTAAMKRKDSERAKIYANELSEVKKLQKKVHDSILMLEQLIIRIETLREFGMAFAQLKPTLEVVKQTANQISEIMPEISNELTNIGNFLQELMINVNIKEMENVFIKMPECDKIIEEATNVLNEKLEKEIPLPPIDKKIKTAIAIGGNEEFFNDEKNELFLNYLIKNEGGFDLEECSRACEVSKEEIIKIMENLSRRGVIKILINEGKLNGIYSRT